MDEANQIRQTLQQVRELDITLLKILVAEDDGNVSTVKQLLMDSIDEIDYVLGDEEDKDISLEEALSHIQQKHKGIYPPKGGLSDFFIYRTDPDEDQKANRELYAIEVELKWLAWNGFHA